MTSILERLASNSLAAIDDGVYDIRQSIPSFDTDMTRALDATAHAPLVAEVKFASPSIGKIRTLADPASIASEMIAGGAVALSVLTQPHLFGGSPEHFVRVRQEVNAPMLMKDVIVDKVQIDAAKKMGADCILLIASLFEKGHVADIDSHIRYAHRNGLQVLLEVHTISEMRLALETDAELIGVNNRDLDTLKVDLRTTQRIMAMVKADRPILAESGIETPDDIRHLKECGASAFLVGSSIMKSDNIRRRVRELVMAY